MLVNDDRVLNKKNFHPVLFLMGDDEQSRLATGVYEVCHFGIFPFLPGLKDYRNTGTWRLEEIENEDGVCDNYQQILDKEPTLQDPKRQFFITLKKVIKKDQSEYG